MMNLVSLMFPLAATVFLFALGVGTGRLILRSRRWQFDSFLEFHCVAGSIGMGILAHVTLLLGLMGGWQAGGFAVIGILFIAAALAGFQPIRRAGLTQPPSSDPPKPTEVIVLIVLVFVLACQALRTTTPSANYDVLEYHLGAVRHWLRAGQIFPFRHLFYAALPFEVEMWYATGCFLEGNPLLPATPKLISFGLLLFNLATVYVLASILCRRRSFRLLACLIFALHPLSSVGAADALNDLGLTWYASLSFLMWLKWLNTRERLFFLLWAVFLGLTLCCKYTAVGLIVFPAVLFLLPVAFFAARRKLPTSCDELPKTAIPRQPDESSPASHFSPPASYLDRWRRTSGLLFREYLTIALVIAAVFWPWALKNALHFRNPVYPVLSGLFPSPTWTPKQTDFYMKAHGRTNPLHEAYWRGLARSLQRLGPWLILAMAGGCLARRKESGVGALTAAVACGIAGHSLFPGNPTRFLLPLVPLATVLAVRCIEQIHRPPLRSAVIAPFILWIGLGTFAAVDPPMFRDPAPGFERVGLPVFTEAPTAGDLIRYLFLRVSRLEVLAQIVGPAVVESQRFINEQTPPDSRIFLLYEARIGCFDRQVEAGSVFDRSPLVERAAQVHSANELLARLRADGFDYLYVNEFELARLVETYTPADLWTTLSETKPIFLGPETDILQVVKYSKFYPPYLQDPRWQRCQAVVEDFIDSCRRRAIYSIEPGFPYGIWIAPLR